MLGDSRLLFYSTRMQFLGHGCLLFSHCHLKNSKGLKKGAGFSKAHGELYHHFCEQIVNVVFKLNQKLRSLFWNKALCKTEAVFPLEKHICAVFFPPLLAHLFALHKELSML